MRIGGVAALGAARRRAGHVLRTPAATGIAIIAPLVLAGAVGASAPTPVRDNAVTPLAAVAPTAPKDTGASVVAVKKAPDHFQIAASTVSAPPPAVVVNSPGNMKIPAMALSAYRNAERIMATAAPKCGVSWNLLAGIGRIESGHANGGATDASGTPVNPIYGPALDGTLPGNEVIELSRSAGRVTYARAMGPMQFLPGTWARYASDGDGDGEADVQNLYDSTLAAARYLCSGGLNLRDSSQVMTAILRYNNSVAYARNVLSWAGGYATGVVPVDLPPITGSVPQLGDAHLDSYQGLGPELAMATGDPMALLPLMSRNDAGQLPTGNVHGTPGPLLGPLPGPAPEATLQPAAPPAPWTPPWLAPPPAPAPAGPPPCVVFCPGAPAPAPAPGPAPVLAGPAPLGPPPGPVA
ncbi:lytic transglycosylase [Mycobacterium sp. 852013-51886_SCH5428379]|uniref:lytic transglycosylase domain-containing protein n=1 Tax=Mycobacterium sp. 852013-51886_SCH5428379 TaxID=1834111 RepID=UPI0007FDDB5F|nr:lytic murein transglycosylase [Mycobacterium sp. 852013-51886_SCH5428379]OBB61096.1 lytic transglycosylase [Mycobacterium sp. 852013-51886_SCH5428379]